MTISPPAIAKDQPTWVCAQCGEKWGRWWDGPQYNGPSKHCATMHEGECNVCSKLTIVTEARDFGYLRNGWDEK